MSSNEVTIVGLIVRVKRALEILQISRSSAYAKWDPQSPQYDSTFPKRIRLGANSVGLLLSEIEAWVECRAKEREYQEKRGAA